MNILAMDTSTIVSSVAIASEEKLMAELTIETKMTHSETLVPHIAQAMEMAGLDRSDLDAVAVTIGPGSFTGLRIGLATAKGMAYSLGLTIVGVPTLEALAYKCPVPGINLIPLIDAQKGNAYAAHYIWENGCLVEKRAVEVMSLQEVIEYCGTIEGNVLLLGDAARKKIARVGELPKNTEIAPIQSVMPDAACVAKRAMDLMVEGQTGSVMDMEPIYIRRSEAEVLWEKRQVALKEQEKD